jgi:hypothetical protein
MLPKEERTRTLTVSCNIRNMGLCNYIWWVPMVYYDGIRYAWATNVLQL